MVEENNAVLAGKFWWGEDHWPDYALELFENGKFATYKGPESDYDLPMTPTGTSYYAEGTYTIQGTQVICKGSGK